MLAGRRIVGFGLMLGALALAGAAHAQGGEEETGEEGAEEAPAEGAEPGETAAGEGEAEEAGAEAEAADEEKDEDEKKVGEGEDSGMDPELDPKEKPHEPYFFLGLRFRDIIVPEFMMRIFVDGGQTVNVFTFGPEFTYRKDELEIILSLSYADYSMDPVIMRGKDEDVSAYEMVESDLKAIYGTIDILFEVYEEPKGRFAILIGGGVGLAGVFDELRRRQIYPKNPGDADPDDPDKWNSCTAPGAPPDVASDGTPWCDDSNDHYGDYAEPSWANGGSKPFIYPWIALPQVSFRYKPIKQFQARADLGFAISTGFYLGLGAAYGF